MTEELPVGGGVVPKFQPKVEDIPLNHVTKIA